MISDWTLIGPVGTATSAVVAAIAFVRTQAVRRNDIRREAELREEDAHRDRLKDARAAWADYLKSAFANPQFSSGFDFSNAAATDREKYEWYVTGVLFCAEGILDAVPMDEYWRKTVMTQFDHHAKYLKSNSFTPYESGYSPRVQNLLAGWRGGMGSRPVQGALAGA